MIIFNTPQESILKAMQTVAGMIERRHTNLILANVLVKRSDSGLEFIGNNLDMQIRSVAQLDGDQTQFATTFSCSKMLDILHSLPAGQIVSLSYKQERLQLESGKSRFVLQSLPAIDFPVIDQSESLGETFSIPQKIFKKLIQEVSFSMAVNDIRYYLNGILFVAKGNTLKLVATDGHRLAYTESTLAISMPEQEVIIPRKTVIQLQRLLSDNETEIIEIQFGNNQAKFKFDNIEFISKLIEGKFPDFNRVIPTSLPHQTSIDRLGLLTALQRASIMTNDKSRGVRMHIKTGLIRLLSHNTEQEEAQDEVEINYTGDTIETGFNVTYLMDVLTNNDSKLMEMSFNDASSSVMFTYQDNPSFRYVVMPMKI